MDYGAVRFFLGGGEGFRGLFGFLFVCKEINAFGALNRS
jgi:hypothetical protein